MMNYTKWNDPKTYERMTAELAAYTVPETPIFAARDDEHIEHSRVQYCMHYRAEFSPIDARDENA